MCYRNWLSENLSKSIIFLNLPARYSFNFIRHFRFIGCFWHFRPGKQREKFTFKSEIISREFNSTPLLYNTMLLRITLYRITPDWAAWASVWLTVSWIGRNLQEGICMPKQCMEEGQICWGRGVLDCSLAVFVFAVINYDYPVDIGSMLFVVVGGILCFWIFRQLWS